MKCAALSALLVFGCTLYGAEKQERDTENAMLAAYSNLQYSEARRLAAKSDRPEFKLISALCDVFDRRTQNLRNCLNVTAAWLNSLTHGQITRLR